MATDVTATIPGSDAASATTTSRGTAIVKKDAALDQNSFLKILSAELSNQDPTNATDGTAYVAQMAQFASLEQTTNLNNTMTFASSSALMGKLVAFSSTNAAGVQDEGTVEGVYKDSGSTYMEVKLTDGTTKDFSADTLTDVINLPDSDTDYLNGNTGFSAAISLMGKQVTTSALADGNVYSGTVKSVTKDGNGINLTLSYQENGADVTKDISYDDIAKVG